LNGHTLEPQEPNSPRIHEQSNPIRKRAKTLSNQKSNEIITYASKSQAIITREESGSLMVRESNENILVTYISQQQQFSQDLLKELISMREQMNKRQPDPLELPVTRTKIGILLGICFWYIFLSSKITIISIPQVLLDWIHRDSYLWTPILYLFNGLEHIAIGIICVVLSIFFIKVSRDTFFSGISIALYMYSPLSVYRLLATLLPVIIIYYSIIKRTDTYTRWDIFFLVFLFPIMGYYAGQCDPLNPDYQPCLLDRFSLFFKPNPNHIHWFA